MELLRRLGPVRTWLLLGAVAVLVAGGIWYVVSLPTKVDRLPAQAYGKDWYAVCEDTAYTKAAPYEGRGPHEIVIFGAPGGGAGDVAESDKPPATWQPRRPEQVTLVACAEFEDLLDVAAECPVGGRRSLYPTFGSRPERTTATLSLWRTAYKVTVYEARTRDEVASMDVTGQDTSCPYSPSGLMRSGISSAQWKRLLARYVEADRD
ncbi:hypothetical protein [Spirillospora sp. NPDC029432]|uniref:hypothetical protein n=1 Tax=Spirillospora sp. NPDC029432 TaxID=3154599 RepID=UPI00345234F7